MGWPREVLPVFQKPMCSLHMHFDAKHPDVAPPGSLCAPPSERDVVHAWASHDGCEEKKWETMRNRTEELDVAMGPPSATPPANVPNPSSSTSSSSSSTEACAEHTRPLESVGQRRKVEFSWTRPRKWRNINVSDSDSTLEGELFK